MNPASSPSASSITIGTDIVEIERFRSMRSDAPFLRRTFSQEELRYCMSYSTPAPHLAATYAGKEAVVKAIGERESVGIQDVEIFRSAAGTPHVNLSKACTLHVALSLSHSKNYAVAMAIAFPAQDGLNEDELRKLLNGTISQIQPE